MYGALGYWVFEPNPDDICVMNKTVDRKQCTILWNVDDINISHMSPKVVKGVLSQLATKYGKVSLLSVIRGCIHDYLGMRLEYVTKSKARITIPKYIESILEAAE